MKPSEYVCYENSIRRNSIISVRKTTKEEWTERFEFVYKSSKDYIALNKTISDAHIKYITYKNKHLYTNDQETTSEKQSELYNIYYDEYKKQSDLKASILKGFKERFPNIKNPLYELEQHYLYCCEVYTSHKLKGVEYNLPFPVETDVQPIQINDFQVLVEESNPIENKLPLPQKPSASLDDLLILMQKISKAPIIKEKKKYPKKHTLSILLTQEKEKTKKLQEILEHMPSKDIVSDNSLSQCKI